jgi:hypothetical protein
VTFEREFTAFIQIFGGEKISETSEGATADFFLGQRSFVAELKVLSGDRTQTINTQVEKMVREWVISDPDGAREFVRRNPKAIELRQMPPEIRERWMTLLKKGLEQYVKSANRQIRSTKSRYKLPTARGLLIVFNEADHYHAHPDSFRRVIAEILRKRKPDGTLRYTNIDGLTYFSYETVKAHGKQMSFWANAQFPHSPEDDCSDVKEMQARLQSSWYAYVSIRHGRLVRNHLEPATPR